MTAGDRHLDRALDVPLAFDVREIDLVTLMRGEELAPIAAHRGQLLFSPNELKSLAQILHAVDVDAGDHGGFARVRRWHDHRAFAAAPRFERDRKHTFDRAHPAVERELADEAEIGEQILLDFLCRGDHAERDRQVEARSFLFDVGRREVDRRAPARPIVAAITDRGRDAILALFHRSVGQTNDDDLRISARGVDLDFDLVGIDAENSS